MDRRKFLKQSCGACAAVSLGLIFGASLLESCGSTGLSVWKASPDNGKVKIPLTSFAQNKFKLLRVSSYMYDIAVQQQEDGTFSALVLVCTHARHPLTKAGSGYYCTLHGSKFSTAGQVARGPASKPLDRLATEVKDEALWITL